MSLEQSYFEEFYASKRVNGIVANYLNQERGRVDIVGSNHKAERDDDEAYDVAWQATTCESSDLGNLHSKQEYRFRGWDKLMVRLSVGRKSGTLFQCPTCKLDILPDLMIPEIREEVNFESESLRAHSWQKCLKCSSLT